MKYILATAIFLILIGSCKSTKQMQIEFDDGFLSSHEWVIDSIYGSDEFVRDWIFFTPDEKFYRFSKYNKSYIVDSALTWKRNQVFKNGKELFKITKIDSEHIELKSADKIFQAERWNRFNRENIERNIADNVYKLQINGKWKIDSIEIEKARMPSYCDLITAGSIFDFRDDGRLQVFQKDSTNYCNQYSYRISEDDISLIEYDMVLNFPIQMLGKEKMILKSRYIPRNVWDEEIWKAKKEGFNLYFSKLE